MSTKKPLLIVCAVAALELIVALTVAGVIYEAVGVIYEAASIPDTPEELVSEWCSLNNNELTTDKDMIPLFTRTNGNQVAEYLRFPFIKFEPMEIVKISKYYVLGYACSKDGSEAVLYIRETQRGWKIKLVELSGTQRRPIVIK